MIIRYIIITLDCMMLYDYTLYHNNTRLYDVIMIIRYIRITLDCMMLYDYTLYYNNTRLCDVI